MSKKKPFVIQFKSSDGRRARLAISFTGRRLSLRAEVEGSNKLKKIGEWSDLGVTMAPDADIDVIKHFMQVLSL